LVGGSVIAATQIDADSTWEVTIELPGTSNIQVYAQSLDMAGKVTSVTRPMSCTVATETSMPTKMPTSTPLPPTATSAPPTATYVPPTATYAPPTATYAPPTATPLALTISGCEYALSSPETTLTGTGAPNSLLYLYVDTASLDIVEVDAAGRWTYSVTFASPGEYNLYMQAFDETGAVTAVSAPVRCVVSAAQKPPRLPSTGVAIMKNSEIIWATLLIGFLIGLVGLYESRKRNQ